MQAHAQAMLDTRALEVAAEAKAIILAHREECELNRTYVSSTFADIKAMIHMISARMWAVAGATILTLLSVVGALIYIVLVHGAHP